MVMLYVKQSSVSLSLCFFLVLPLRVSGQQATATGYVDDDDDDSDYMACDRVTTCIKKEHPPVDINDYYATITVGLTSNELRTELNSIIRDHFRYSYTPCVWEMIADTDQDPENPDNVIDLYTGRSIPLLRRDCGYNDNDAWNREHVWAKSHGFPNDKQHGYTDINHLCAADKSVNGDRSNYDFKMGGNEHDECTGCSLDSAAATWEPPDRVKGRIARMLMYMEIRYNGNDESDGGMPDLVLVDTSTKGLKEPTIGYLPDLLDWHCKFPVSDTERIRNNKVHSWQGNRNPFIDHPEYVESIWNHTCGADKKVVNDNNNDTKEQQPDEKSATELKLISILNQIQKIESEVNDLLCDENPNSEEYCGSTTTTTSSSTSTGLSYEL
jgi:endonuclease I